MVAEAGLQEHGDSLYCPVKFYILLKFSMKEGREEGRKGGREGGKEGN
jgi:hypothetical protein